LIKSALYNLKEKMSEINKYYDNLVLLVESMLGHSDTTFNTDLNQIGKNLFKSKWKGVYSFDQIPKNLSDKQMLIFNLDKSNEPGSHWCSLYQNKDKAIVYDSFGRRVLGSGKSIIYTERDKEQKLIENNCGQRCLAWLILIQILGPQAALLI
jgi:hypothetical protein